MNLLIFDSIVATKRALACEYLTKCLKVDLHSIIFILLFFIL